MLNNYPLEFRKKQRLLSKNELVNDFLITISAYNKLITGNIIPFIEILKTSLLTRSQMSLFSANEPVLQVLYYFIRHITITFL